MLHELHELNEFKKIKDFYIVAVSRCHAHAVNEARFFTNNTRCQADPNACARNLTSWISLTSSHLRQVDPNHMIAIGYEGFYRTYWRSPQWGGGKHNPSGGWANNLGQDFLINAGLGTISYTEAHYWWAIDIDINKIELL